MFLCFGIDIKRMTFNSLTLEACCDKCKTAWRSRTGNIPKKCHKCGSNAWNCGTRKFTSIIARAGTENLETHYREFCIIDYVDNPAVKSDNVFYVSKEDLDKYIGNNRYPPGSAVIWIGDMSIGEDRLLKINELKLVYCHEATFLNYHSSITCIFNVRSFHERAKALRKYEEDKLIQEQKEDAKKEAAVKQARARLDAARARDLKIAEAERMLEDDTVSTNDKLEAIKLLRK